MTPYDANYIDVLPDYTYNGVKSTSTDHRDDDAKVTSREVLVTSPYEHPHPSDAAKSSSTYQRLLGNDLRRQVTSDMTYDEIVDIPSPPPPRPGTQFSVFGFMSNPVYLTKD